MARSRRSARRPYSAEHPPLDLQRATGGRSAVSAADGEWVVQQVGVSERVYRCPGCDQPVTEVAHVVVWRTDALLDNGVAGRRHWHSGCWNRRTPRR